MTVPSLRLHSYAASSSATCNAPLAPATAVGRAATMPASERGGAIPATLTAGTAVPCAAPGAFLQYCLPCSAYYVVDVFVNAEFRDFSRNVRIRRN